MDHLIPGIARPLCRLSIWLLCSIATASASLAGEKLATVRASLGATGSQANNSMLTSACVNSDGRFVVFQTSASNLVPNDNNGTIDVFLRDMQRNTTECISVTPAGIPANNASTYPSISADGRYVAFSSAASDIIPGLIHVGGIYVRDRVLGITFLVSQSSTGEQGNNGSTMPSISADGQMVAFQSTATNLVPGDTNGVSDVFVREISAGVTIRVSTSSTSVQANGQSQNCAISGDGRFIGFDSAANNLVSSDTNSNYDVFVRDLVLGTTECVSLSMTGSTGNGYSNFLYSSLSYDGRFVTFPSGADNLVSGDLNGFQDVFVRDRLLNTTRRISVGLGGQEANEYSLSPSISADGRSLSFISLASNLIANDTNSERDAFWTDLQTGQIIRESVSSTNAQSNGVTFFGAMSRDGKYVVFLSVATNLVVGDTNNYQDVFERGPARFNKVGN